MRDIEPINPHAVYTVMQAAEVLNLGRNTVYRLIGQGSIKAVRVGPRVMRVHGAELLAFVERGGTPAAVNVIPDQVRRRAVA